MERATTSEPRAASSSSTASAASTAEPPAVPARVALPSPSPAPSANEPRIHAKARFVWVHPSPGSSAWIGYLTLGGAVRLRGGSVESARVGGNGRCDAWYAVEPMGVVCANASSTVDPSDPAYVAIARDGPDVTSPWPFSYGESLGTPRYDTIPSEAKQRATEWKLAEHLADVARAREATSDDAVREINKALVGVDLRPAGVTAPELIEIGPAVREGRDRVVLGSTVAYSRQFDAEGRTFLLTSDRALVPKDRVRPYPRSTYQGVKLEGDVKLPIAFFRKTERPKYQRTPEGELVETGASWPRLAWVGLTGQSITVGKQRFHETREPGIYVREADASIADRTAKPPTRRGETPRTWMEVSILGGWLIAYEADQPVFTTLISPGRGGLPARGIDPLKTASTPVGTYQVDGKFRSATMVSSSSADIVHADVQYVQNFHGPHALHGAYWHDAWGEPKSGGCINLSPIDSKWLFDWTDPKVPEGWHGLRSMPEFGPPTIVIVHK
jgi:hypothetical protein